MEKLLYSVGEAQALISISNTGLYKAIASGELKSHKVGRRRLFTAEALRAYAARIALGEQARGAP